ncbi:increased DNA methylation 2 [Sesamum indicum]|uniref:Increased DNA methylation 2 n=1 Tax=Sesamum indicum TaxID=4182 RepID=A0A6I9TP34_SESIN|nr:increased DNA methylation 2 [Sesamum indicum]XP_011087380.1 increased DNA methylation 2 [Sesamum indicum]XP_011087381.1 increased DNA methylation 2 [Sesamum indicum]XP_011087382.1 increased DNA methylation 2 [Sesamum indicum]
MESMSCALLTDDQYFLLYLIMGVYFGPNLKEGRPLKSALQRNAEGCTEYQANDLAGSHIKTVVMESVYYYILRKAEPSVVVKQHLLLQYIHGSLPISVQCSRICLQFDDLFPSKLHPRSQFKNQQETIDDIVFINNPEIDYIKPGDIERFKRLTGLEDFRLDRESAMQHIFVDSRVLHNVKVQETTSKLHDTIQHVNVQRVNYVPCSETCPDGNEPSNCTMPFSCSPLNASPLSYDSPVLAQMTGSYGEDLDQGIIFLPSCPSKEEWANLVATVKCGFALTGSAARGHVGPVLGLMDVGESEDSYLFRVSLPGVRRDERDFSCEVESDGTVIIKGVTVTGEITVEKYSQAFIMQSQNLCPPGPFSISFKLPGPVDPQEFHGTFATDGILEGIALKARRYRS